MVDDLDKQILRALQISPRAPFALIAAVLGTSEQTVARRYRRMRRTGVVRVLGVLNPRALGQSDWLVRIECRPAGSPAVADALAQRDDVSWVSLAAGGSEVTCALRSRTSQARDDLLERRLPRSAPVLRVRAAVVLHLFLGGGTDDDWAGLAHVIDGRATARLAGPGVAMSTPASPPDVLDRADEAIVRLLRSDGRATIGELAAAAGISEGRAARRLAALQSGGIVYFDVDLSTRALGFEGQANLWLTVSPASLEAAGQALSRAPEVAFAVAVSGPQNLNASVVCRDLDALYRFTTTTIAALPGVQTLEISPVLRHVKQAGSLVEGDRLTD